MRPCHALANFLVRLHPHRFDVPMDILSHSIQLATAAPIEVVDVTAPVREWVRASGIRRGLLTISSLHTTARVNINEREGELQRDMVDFLARLAPADAPYGHNQNTVDGRSNAHSHLIGLLMHASETVQVADGALVLGEWQSIFFVELDGPRGARELRLQLIGER